MLASEYWCYKGKRRKVGMCGVGGDVDAGTLLAVLWKEQRGP